MTTFQDPASLAQLHAELGIPQNYASNRGLIVHQEVSAQDLTEITSAGNRAIQLSIPAAAAWSSLQLRAQHEDIILLPLSGFRSVERQAEIIRAHLRTGRTMTDILGAIAAPGFSEHHTGRAIDIGTPNSTPVDESFAHTAAFQWLTRNAGNHGFIMTYLANKPHGFVYEPWHWCWHPSEEFTSAV